MTIELYFSNQLDQLAHKFSDVVTDEIRCKDNILEPPVVIVPNANLAKWLQLALAEKNSIIMNVEFQYLEAGLWGMLTALDAGENKPDIMDIIDAVHEAMAMPGAFWEEDEDEDPPTFH